MAHSDKNIVITPNVGSTSADPRIVFSGADAATGPQNITVQVYPTNSGTLSFEGSAGQLFSITNSLSGSIFSVNDVSGIPSIEVLDTGVIRLAQYNGKVGVGTSNPAQLFSVAGTLGISEVGATGGRLLVSTSGAGANINQNDNSPINLQIQGTTALTVSAARNIGISTPSPTALFHTTKTTTGDTTDAIWRHTYDSNWGITLNQQHVNGSHIQWNWVDNAGNNLLIWKQGLVGIGRTPARTLDVEGGLRAVQIYAATTGALTIRQNSTNTVGGYIQWVNNANTAETGWLTVDTSSNMIFGVPSSERLRINSSGNVIATVDFRAPIFYDSDNTAYYTNPASTSVVNQISVAGSDNKIQVGNTTNTSTAETIGMQLYGAYSDGRYAHRFRKYDQGGGVPLFLDRTSATANVWSPLARWGDFSGNGFEYEVFGDMKASGSVYSPIFYDSDNTAYYIDPNNGGFSLAGGSSNRVAFYTNDSGYQISNAEGVAAVVRLGAAWAQPGSYSSTSYTVGSESTIKFWTQGVERGYIDNAGNLFATTSLRAPSHYITADTINRFQQGALILRGGSPTIYLRDTDHNSAMLHCNSNLFYILRGANDTESWATVNGWWPVYWDLTNNNQISGGGIFAVGDVTAYYSDERLKSIESTIPNALEKVNSLRGFYYYENEVAKKIGYNNDKKQVGVSAQAVQRVLPEAVADAPFDRDEKGNSRSGENYLTVKYEKLVPLLIEAIKELTQKVAELEKQVNGKQ